MPSTALATNDYFDDYRDHSWDIASGHLPADVACGWGAATTYGPFGIPGTAGALGYKTARLVIPNRSVPQWFAQALEKTNDLLRLPLNWDSYGAKRVDTQSALTSLQILAAAVLDVDAVPVQIVPTPQGGVQLEWHGAHGDLELCIELPMISIFYENTNDPAKDRQQFVNFSAAVEAIRTLIKDLN